MEARSGKLSAIPMDTDPAVFEMQVQIWRAMSASDRAALADQLSMDIAKMAEAGIRYASPAISDAGVLYELAVRRYGREFADAAFAQVSK